MEVEPSSAAPRRFSGGAGAGSSRGGGGAAATDDGDDDVVFEGRTGDLALADFPHARENCAEKPWQPGSERNACPNCYCFVCDKPASECPEWASSHCMATHKSAHWRAERAAWKANGGTKPAKPAAAPSAAARPSAPSASSSGHGPRRLRPVPEAERKRWSAARFLKACEQVYPVEESEPPGFAPSIRLRPYQRQSLAFMLALEGSSDQSLVGQPSAKGMRSPASSVRGGWLADEMGMGKTAVCAALVCASKAKHGRMLTVVLVNNSLVGQWLDELEKFAPLLHVCRYYGSKQPINS